MSVYPEKITISYVSKGEKEFVIPFNFLENESVKVFCGDERIAQILNKDFTVNDGYVIFAENVPDGVIVRIERQTDLTQTAKFLNNAKLPADVLNFSFDKVIMICQELAEKLQRALLADGEFDFSLEDILKDIELIRIFAANLSSVADSATKAAVSAAQALISAIEARQYRDAAKELTDFATSLSDITLHNQYAESHPYILKLIQDLQNLFDNHTSDYQKHIEDYDTLKTKNNEDHESFDNFNSKVSERLSKLENNSAVIANNRFFAFGLNNYSQLGMNFNYNITEAPMEHCGLNNVSKVALYSTCSAAISGERLYVTGLGGNGFCGSKLTQNFAFAPHDCVDTLNGWTDVAVFNETGIGIRNGKIYSWGAGGNYINGDGTMLSHCEPREISIPGVKFKNVAAGIGVALALTEDGKVYSCGISAFGALGDGTVNNSNASMTLSPYLENVTQISAGGIVGSAWGGFCAAISKKSEERTKLFVWGYNGFGNLGTGDTTDVSKPAEIILPDNEEPQRVVCGTSHIAVLTTSGRVYISGDAAALQQTANQLTFKHVVSDQIFGDIAAGRACTYMLNIDGVLYGMGQNLYGSLLTNANSNVPKILVQGKIKRIFSGCDHYGCAFTVEDENA